jgi:RsmE family RNA methyltransferase
VAVLSDTPRIHLFVSDGAVRGQQMALQGAEAARAFQKGLRSGMAFTALDGMGWALDVDVVEAGPSLCYGRVTGRRLAAERRSKVTAYQAMIHPSDFRRFLGLATGLGVVAFQPVIADGSVLPRLDAEGRPEGEAEWPLLIRDAAEAAGRGQLPQVELPMLLDAAFDQAHGAGARLILDASGQPLEAVLVNRPFSLACFLPPPGGFTAAELQRAVAQGLLRVAPPETSRDPIQPAVTLLRRIYELLEGG